MASRDLEGLLEEYQKTLGRDHPQSREVARFREFLLQHGGLGRLEPPGLPPRLLARGDMLRCFHFSQYLDWYLSEKRGLSRPQIQEARNAIGGFNEWLREIGIIGREDFEENQESISGGDSGPPVFESLGASEEEEEGALLPGVREEQDFYVPGEYSSVLSGEFVLTKVQEGILYGIREDEREETGPILVDREVSAGSRVGDRVYLSLGKAGDHWNLLGIGRCRS